MPGSRPISLAHVASAATGSSARTIRFNGRGVPWRGPFPSITIIGDDEVINLYKYGIARMYLNLDDSGACYVCRGNGTYEMASFAVELAKLEAALARLGETLESTYDDSYKARKEKALRKAGISLLRIEIEPENSSPN